MNHHPYGMGKSRIDISQCYEHKFLKNSGMNSKTLILVTHELPDLPYPKDTLEPHISAETIEYHYGKHHATYVDKLNKLISATEFEKASLDAILHKSSGNIFNNAAQVWNHIFYWNSMHPNGGGGPEGTLAKTINESFGGVRILKKSLLKMQLETSAQAGHGWLEMPMANWPSSTPAMRRILCAPASCHY